MKSKWIHRKENKKLILFCNGWGMDEYPFSPLKSNEWNVLMFHDYSDLVPDQDLHAIFNEYTEIVLIAWSMGVWAGQQIFSPFQNGLRGALAINGTLCPVDDQFGIPIDVVQATIDNYNHKQRMKFYHRMCRDRALFCEFMNNQPLRNITDQKQELAHLLKIANCNKNAKSIYTCALVSRHDFIMPTVNQLNFWPEKMVRQVEGYHFLFYSYKSWGEVLLELERMNVED